MMNNINIMGRITADPELRQTKEGTSVCRFTVAVQRDGKADANGNRQSDFINCVAWKQTAEFIAKYFAKGQMMGITGALRTGSYTDRRYSDVTHFTAEVFCDHVYFCGAKQQTGSTQAAPNTAPTQQAFDTMAAYAGDFEDFGETDPDGLPF